MAMAIYGTVDSPSCDGVTHHSLGYAYVKYLNASDGRLLHHWCIHYLLINSLGECALEQLSYLLIKNCMWYV